uniref:Uncharacterized protein n=1 Tax=Leptobrachium leishanense TaxID=445787 RepID=A0A8C5PIN9_9ANUR
MAGVARDPESSPLPPCCLYASPCPSDDSESEEEAADAGLDFLRQTSHAVPRSKSRAVPRSKSRAVPRSKSRAVPRSRSRTVPRSRSRTVLRSRSRAVPRSRSRAVPRSRSRAVPRSRSRAVPRSRSRAVPRSRSRAVPRSRSRAVPRSRSRAVPRSRSRCRTEVQEPCCTEVQEPCFTEVQAQTAATKTAFVDTDTAEATLPIPGKASPSSAVLVLVSAMAAQVNTLTHTIQDMQLNHKFLQSQVQVALARGHSSTPDLVATSNPIHLDEPAESSQLSPPRGRRRRCKAKVAAAEPCSAMEVAAAEPCSAKEVAKVAAPPVFFKGAAPPVAKGAAPPHLVKGTAPPCHAKGAAPLYPAVAVETPISITHCWQFPALAVPRRVWGFSKVDSPIPHSHKFGLYSGQPSQDAAHLGIADATSDGAIRMDPYTVQGFMMDSSTARWLTLGRPEVDS